MNGSSRVICSNMTERTMSESPGYFGIGIYQAKRFENVGVLWRGAYQLGASFIFTIGKRYRRQDEIGTPFCCFGYFGLYVF